MSKTFTFGFLGEDVAQKNFLVHYLESQYKGVFSEVTEFGWRVKANTKDEVDANLQAALLFKIRFGLDVLFIGRDTDSSEKKSVESCREKIANPFKGQSGVIFMIPIQCIEHWLWYLKWKRDNSGSTKNEPLESFKRTQAKNVVYGEKAKAETRMHLANSLLADLDVTWLESRSESFRHFHRQVTDFLTQYAKGQ
ncbi:hypothetical protein [Spirosoma pollinicola]|uniref:DUF4276 domain-containing protein n=1 Tax=Spirosoma pollinicola TaxID=2057025 RepID=A0A2K8Z064_9BACT|nr:hypothetical protein [Spirosoma pollinicola]AUD03198.1 hypothetical protein CWM47_15960 [Spirosoma pollinicola]